VESHFSGEAGVAQNPINLKMKLLHKGGFGQAERNFIYGLVDVFARSNGNDTNQKTTCLPLWPLDHLQRWPDMRRFSCAKSLRNFQD
jgi:hypothetical protein